MAEDMEMQFPPVHAPGNELDEYGVLVEARWGNWSLLSKILTVKDFAEVFHAPEVPGCGMPGPVATVYFFSQTHLRGVPFEELCKAVEERATEQSARPGESIFFKEEDGSRARAAALHAVMGAKLYNHVFRGSPDVALADLLRPQRACILMPSLREPFVLVAVRKTDRGPERSELGTVRFFNPETNDDRLEFRPSGLVPDGIADPASFIPPGPHTAEDLVKHLDRYAEKVPRSTRKRARP